MKRQSNFLNSLMSRKKAKKLDSSIEGSHQSLKIPNTQESEDIFEVPSTTGSIHAPLAALVTQSSLFNPSEDVSVKNENGLVCGSMINLNNDGSETLHFGLNPHRNYIHEYRIINRKKEYLKMNFDELEYFVTMAKQSSLEMPFRISLSLHGTKKLFKNSEEMFMLERQCNIPEGCTNKIYIGEKSLDRIRDLYPVIKLTYEDADNTTLDDMKIFVRQIAEQFEYRSPTYKEIMLWYTECDKLKFPENRLIHNLKREMFMNFGDLLVTEVNQLCLKTRKNNGYSFSD